MEQGEKPQINWVHINKAQLAELTDDLYRYRLMYRILFVYLILVLLPFNFLYLYFVSFLHLLYLAAYV